ncbi:SDR family oxidoreductase [Geomicrobium sp. JCM 19038]|uniref:SDR family oxidoreductase n=1 Tax=Geomicrobium sp. JCM 19038 TaxID=1460635 RepID=UPI00045F3162|nr:NmrA family NAD(P)-binding protein [Geomicrobium sp. JCM 19038]GAK09154.1 oxidoreductase [Geomicrobium sp. JCM 19038]
MTILVTGATGTIGSHMVNVLAEKGYRVKALTRNPHFAHFPEGVEAVKGDLMDAESLLSALEGVDAMYLLTSSDQLENDLNTGAEVVRMAEASGVNKVTLFTLYGEAQLRTPLKKSSMDWTFVQAVGFMSNILDDWREIIIKGDTVETFYGDKKTSMIHEKDISEVMVETLINDKHNHQFYTLTGPELISQIDCLKIIGEQIGKQIPVKEMTEKEARNHWRQKGFDEESIEFFVQMSVETPEVGLHVLPTVREILGKEGRTFEQWAEENKHYFLPEKDGNTNG